MLQSGSAGVARGCIHACTSCIASLQIYLQEHAMLAHSCCCQACSGPGISFLQGQLQLTGAAIIHKHGTTSAAVPSPAEAAATSRGSSRQ
jgi:hypothetical protein